MSEDKINVYEVVKKLVGPIEAYGDSNIDRDRLENLEVLGELTYRLVTDLYNASLSKDRYESSMIGKKAQYCLDCISDYCVETEVKQK